MRNLPGDVSETEALGRMIRVNHAGEYGAKRIYQGQLKMLRSPRARSLVAHMAEQEEAHLAHFTEATRARGIRPTALLPLWHVAGFALGAATALMGEKAAFACTVAVESVIDAHYAEQEQALAARLSPEPALLEAVGRFRAEEREHHDTGLAEGAEAALAYPALTGVIKTASRLAIWLSNRI